MFNQNRTPFYKLWQLKPVLKHVYLREFDTTFNHDLITILRLSSKVGEIIWFQKAHKIKLSTKIYTITVSCLANFQTTAAWTRLDRAILLIAWDRIVGQFSVRLLVDTVAHTFVSTTHAEAISITANFQTDVEKPVALAAAVENLLADILLLNFASRRQQDGSRIPTQHREVFVAEVFVLVLIKKKKEINITFYVFNLLNAM